MRLIIRTRSTHSASEAVGENGLICAIQVIIRKREFDDHETFLQRRLSTNTIANMEPGTLYRRQAPSMNPTTSGSFFSRSTSSAESACGCFKNSFVRPSEKDPNVFESSSNGISSPVSTPIVGVDNNAKVACLCMKNEPFKETICKPHTYRGMEA